MKRKRIFYQTSKLIGSAEDDTYISNPLIVDELFIIVE
jgi:hypothetical protein